MTGVPPVPRAAASGSLSISSGPVRSGGPTGSGRPAGGATGPAAARLLVDAVGDGLACRQAGRLGRSRPRSGPRRPPRRSVRGPGVDRRGASRSRARTAVASRRSAVDLVDLHQPVAGGRLDLLGRAGAGARRHGRRPGRRPSPAGPPADPSRPARPRPGHRARRRRAVRLAGSRRRRPTPARARTASSHRSSASRRSVGARSVEVGRCSGAAPPCRPGSVPRTRRWATAFCASGSTHGRRRSRTTRAEPSAGTASRRSMRHGPEHRVAAAAATRNPTIGRRGRGDRRRRDRQAAIAAGPNGRSTSGRAAAGPGRSPSRRSAGPPRAGSALAIANASSARVARAGGDGVLGDGHADLTRGRRSGPQDLEEGRAAATPRIRPMARKANSVAVTVLASSRIGLLLERRAPSAGSVAATSRDRQLRQRLRQAARRRIALHAAKTRMVDSRGVGDHRRSSVRARARHTPERHVPRLAIDRRPGIPRPARRRLLVAVQHRVPGSVSGRDELPRLPEPRRRGSVRGGLHPVARPEPGRGDVLVRLLGPVRARLPPRRHRSPARDPGHEAVPRRVARGLGHPGRHARRSRRAPSGSRSSAPARPASPSRASSR